MAAQNDEHPLKHFGVPYEDEPHPSIANPAIQANTFKLKPSVLQIVRQNQFSGSHKEDPNLHISVFIQYTDTLKSNGVNPDTIRLLSHLNFDPESPNQYIYHSVCITSIT